MDRCLCLQTMPALPHKQAHRLVCVAAQALSIPAAVAMGGNALAGGHATRLLVKRGGALCGLPPHRYPPKKISHTRISPHRKFFFSSHNKFVAKQVVTNQFVAKRFVARIFKHHAINLPPSLELCSRLTLPLLLLLSNAPLSLTSSSPLLQPP